MKTIKQIADEIGVSKQALQKRLAREPLCTSLSPYISTKNGTKYIDETGESFILQAFDKNSSVKMDIPVYSDTQNNVHSNVHTDVYSDIVKLLQENINTLQKQLEVKDKQIEELTFTIRTQAESINISQKNELAETLIDEKNKLISGKDDVILPSKKNILQRLFKR